MKEIPLTCPACRQTGWHTVTEEPATGDPWYVTECRYCGHKGLIKAHKDIYLRAGAR